MVRNPLFHKFLLLTLLWLGVSIHWWWQRGPATTHPPAQRTKRSPKLHQPFAGLTHKPHCAACEQDQNPVDQPPLAPPARIISQRGRPRAVDTHHAYCPTKTCPYYGWVGQGNIRANGHPGGGIWRQFHCVGCETYFLETYGTLFYGKPRPAERLVRAVAALAEGLGIRAVARVFEVDPNTVQAWLREAADQLEAFSHYLLHDVYVNHMQFDELCA